MTILTSENISGDIEISSTGSVEMSGFLFNQIRQRLDEIREIKDRLKEYHPDLSLSLEENYKNVRNYWIEQEKKLTTESENE